MPAQYKGIFRGTCLILFMAIMGIGCTESLVPTSMPTKLITPTKYPTGTATKTYTPLPTATIVTDTPTPSLTPTSTNTPTITPTPTTYYIYNAPGYYSSGLCTRYLAINWDVDFCIISVEIMRDGKMKFEVTWEVHGLLKHIIMWKESDANNRNMFLMDDLGNKYHHYETGYCAAKRTRLNNDEPCKGYFMFPAPKEGAKRFIFFDNNQGVSIEVSMITTPTPTLTSTPTINPTLDANQ
jgi:hypothetical protein